MQRCNTAGAGNPRHRGGAMTTHPDDTRTAAPATDEVPLEALGDLYRDGITALRGAFPTDWVDRVAEDLDTAFAEARSRPDGAVGRGPNRFYVEIHPEQLRGFVDLATHPWV